LTWRLSKGSDPILGREDLVSEGPLIAGAEKRLEKPLHFEFASTRWLPVVDGIDDEALAGLAAVPVLAGT